MCHSGKFGRLRADAFEGIVHEAVHDVHGLPGDSNLRMDLLENFVDVQSIGFLPPTILILVMTQTGLGALLGEASSRHTS